MELTEKTCQPCEDGQEPLTFEQAQTYLDNVPEWELNNEGTQIYRAFSFKGFYKTMAFVNAVAWIANREGHHPDLEVGFNYCNVHFSTHAIGGLSENDFICAAKVDALFN